MTSNIDGGRSSTGDNAQPAPFRFLDLPRELRDKIYEHTLDCYETHLETGTIIHSSRDGTDGKCIDHEQPLKCTASNSPNLALPIVSRQVQQEYDETRTRVGKELHVYLHAALEIHGGLKMVSDALKLSKPDTIRLLNRSKSITATFDWPVDQNFSSFPDTVTESLSELINRTIWQITELAHKRSRSTSPWEDFTLNMRTSAWENFTFNMRFPSSFGDLHHDYVREYYLEFDEIDGDCKAECLCIRFLVGKRVYQTILTRQLRYAFQCDRPPIIWHEYEESE